MTGTEKAEGRRLNTHENGIQTELAGYIKDKNVFHDPGDAGSYGNSTPVWQVCGASIEVKGFQLKDASDASKTCFFSKFDAKSAIVTDIFKPWETDAKTVASKMAKGERGAIKYHGEILVEILGSGNLAMPKTKAEDDALQSK